MWKLRVGSALVMIGVLGSIARARIEVKDAALGFSFQLPVGFVDNPAGKNAPNVPAGDIVQCYVRPGVGNSGPTFVIVKRLHGTLGEQPSALPSRLRDGRTLDLSEEKWKSFTLPVNRVPESANGISLVTFNVQMPLTPEAVQISVSGPPAHEKRTRTLVKTILASFEGASSWGSSSSGASAGATSSAHSVSSSRLLTPEQRGERLVQGIMQACLFLAVIGAAVLAILARRKPRPSPNAPAPLAKGAPTAAVSPLVATPMRARLLGVVCILFCGVVYIWCVQQPLDEARHNAQSVSVATNGIVLLPALLTAGVLLLMFANRAAVRPKEMTGQRKIVTWGILIALFLVGIALDLWLKSQLKSLGYDHWTSY